ncbi:MAG: hypothetical protein J6L81_03525 [Clostridia bacterium]|nr:hypothetical protein [Clostridia bacterium]
MKVSGWLKEVPPDLRGRFSAFQGVKITKSVCSRNKKQNFIKNKKEYILCSE